MLANFPHFINLSVVSPKAEKTTTIFDSYFCMILKTFSMFLALEL